MLEAIRNRAQSWIAKLILALILIPFALWGVDSYFNRGGRTEAVAEVGGAKITQQTFSDALKEQADRMRQSLGPNFDPAALDTKAFREQVLTRLTEEEAMLQEAESAGLQITDNQIASILQQLPPFQEDGKFSPERYKRVLAQRGYTPAYFENRLRRDVTLEVQQQTLISGAMTPSASVDLITRIAGQKREVSFAEINPTDMTTQVNISSQEIQQYYDAHKTDFTDPQAVRLEYVTLSLNDLAKSIPVTDKQIQDYFAANSAKFGPPEERSARHILIAAPEGDTNARKLARAKAESLLTAIKKAPDTFAEIAKRESQDPGSAASGGSLGTFGRGMMVKPFEDAVFGMKPGEISNLVETQFGFHIIKLDQIHASKPSLESVRSQVVEEVRRQEAQKRFADAAEQFSNLVYEQGSSLKPAAEAMKLPIQTSGWMTRKGLNEPPFNSAKLLEAVFTSEATKSQQNVEPVEIERNVLVAARVIEHQPSRLKPIVDVSNSIRQKLTIEKTASLTEKLGNSMIEALKKGREPSGISWSAFKIVGRQQTGDLDAKMLRAIMRAETAKLPTYLGTPKADGGYRLIRVSRVIEDAASDPMLRSAVEAGLQQTYARADAQAQIDLAKASQKVEIKEGALDKKE